MSSQSKYLIEKYCPVLHGLLVKRKFKKWEKLDDQISDQLKSENDVKTNLIRMLLRVDSSDDKFLFAFAKHIDQVISDLLNQFPLKDKRIWNSVNGKLDNLDDWNYLNPIGEFSVLLKLQKSGFFELEEIEADFPNGRSKDFLFARKENGTKLLIEVLNIHLPLDLTFEEKKRILLDKTQKKINREVENVDDMQLLSTLYIFPVVWFLNIDEVKMNVDFFRDFSSSLGKNYGLTHQIMGFCTYFKTSENRFYFGEASTFVG